ncbi:MAG: gliding motility-associated ABC transporter substrate-binding protein GldG [Bacteroidales bacterium]|nr:gliding motility-associated ABC transporter substrate-binding protein GldG [Bacteroidales bacterium]
MIKRKNIKRNNISLLLFGILIIILVNIISNFVYTRFDLTSEKRYSLSDATKELLKNLDDIVYFQIYLDGEFPAGFKRLRNETREMLDEFRAYSDNIEYEFINPSESNNKNERNDVYKLLIERGLNPTDLQVKTKKGSSQQIIFPGAIVVYKSSELPLELLKTQIGVPSEQVLNNSIQALEFNIASTIKKLSKTQKPKIAFIEGHGELNSKETFDISKSLSDYYTIERIKIDGQLNSLSERKMPDSSKIIIKNKFDAIIIAKPDSVFSEKDKFIIDQFIMRGGKVLWVIDPVLASLDSLQNAESMLAIDKNLNLEDILFKYGVRLNNDLIMDLNALPIPMRTGQIGNQPQIDFFPWYYFPIITPVIKHPIVSNLNAIKTEFISSIDTINVKGIEKTILLTTSPYSRILNTPTLIDLKILQEKADERLYKKQFVPIAVLLEGRFESVFNNRVPPSIKNDSKIGFVNESIPTKMIVISDGDIIKNQFHIPQGYPLPLGYDQFTRETFGNKELILNAMNYLIDDSGLISIRSRELKLRLLDRTEIDKSKLFWQLLNTLGPIILILIFGILQSYFRRKKFTRNWK